jgi:hypothetical protein
VKHHLIAVAGQPAVEVCRQRRLRQQTKGIGPTLGRRHLLRQALGLRQLLRLAEQAVGRGFERSLDDGPHFGREAAADHDHPVVVDPGRQVPVQMPRLGLPLGRDSIDAPPGAGQALDVGGGAGLREVEQRGLILRGRHPRQRSDFGIGDRAPRHRGADQRERRQGMRDPHLLTGRAQSDAGTPVQPVGTRSEAAVPVGA